MPKKSPTVAEALLEAHVEYLMDRLTGPTFADFLAQELDALLDEAGRLTLEEVVTPTMIKRTARRYASEIELGGGLPELVAAVARAVYAHRIHDRTALKDIVSHARWTEAIDKLLEFKSLREKLVRTVVTSPIYTAFASDLLYQGIKDYLSRSGELTRSIPGARSVMKLGRSVINKASPGIEATLDENLRKYVTRSVEATARRSAEAVLRHLDDAGLRKMAREIWDRIKFEPIGTLRADITADDVEELFVIGYEYWRELRRTEFYTGLIEAGIDAFFDAYGSQPLTVLLDDLGIDRDTILTECLHYAPHVLTQLKRKKVLRAFVRRQLEGFYRSGAVERVLAASE
ncbi:hypothetical protein SAMN04488120_11722 [Fontimonas thermophila]|uniref:Uncharacterized protein n=1 Tax=Fontimonas thermophila TaxID=1076937 RepID=A0A1I2KDA6_9GAMM|nr:hypothetical protein [Fontimonas thermophila]SFF65035.1 hypothetical protein SAMN04488120_11722 [Fontimonas thermophila]